MMGETPNPKHRDPNTKNQAPNTQEIPSPKSQFCPRRRRLGACDLEFFWCLELGAWCLDLGVWCLVFRPSSADKRKKRKGKQGVHVECGQHIIHGYTPA